MSKITNPVVLIHKRENSDTYAVAITSGSQDYHDAVLMATMEPDMTGDDVDTWSKTGYYMAEEIQRLRQQLSAPLSIGELIQRLESQTGVRWERVVNDVTSGKPLTITLPDASSKAFWSGTGKGETFHPETYKRWVKEAIERSCVIAGIGVEVK
ncbi:ATPase [Salmonella enterica subsp. salamae]|uniref:ATPase n=1 Tax=Salmonella potsdam TaxID=597 RepID=A0A5U6HD01_SALPO|nr:ATPase [Salmonella enterica]EBQ9426195.1 ATPase [Salmonella enterica subsp. enterica serovar Potsdam]EBS3173938.1 ATPase [Salmonella enterica subsp. enterica serovar Newport]EBS3867981.1 ATPase [Salmonella enterica subsp. enterica serovar Kimberley]ECD9357640.1 ATPase [Salmonella enterica subsp. salamae]EDT6673944.1 ATPase [Salmonella enterica subsp. enterica]HDH3854220.1 ATPase [Salmonella enterica subsp. enterica serovar Oranienburg]